MMLINPHLMLASAHLSVFRFCQSIISVRWVGCLPLLVPTPIAVMLMCELSSLACDAVLLMGELRPAVHSVAVHDAQRTAESVQQLQLCPSLFVWHA
jgi:hypothetical protein